jgi:cardiolipin synthase A/B
MTTNKLLGPETDKYLQQAIINFMNYMVSGGSMIVVSEEAAQAAAFVEKHVDLDAARKYRQELGGIFTNLEQLAAMPESRTGWLEQLAPMISRLDGGKLKALAPQTTWHNEVTPYVNGPECLEMLLDEIKNAQRYIHMSVMLFYNDHSGNLIANELLSALARGVKVRLLVNHMITAMGYEKNLKVGQFTEISEKLEAAGGKVLNTANSKYPAEEWRKLRQELELRGVPKHILFFQDRVQEEGEMGGLNIVDHRKFLIIDGTTSIIGSINIGDQYTFATPVESPSGNQADGIEQGIPSREEEWHDGCFRVRGAAARTFNAVFHSRWILLGGDMFDPGNSFYDPDMDMNFGEEECTLFVSFPGNPVNLIQQYYLDLISYAADETVIVNPYLIDQDFWDRLKGLGPECSCNLTICNPLHVTDHPTNLAAVRSNMYTPFCNGVSFYDYSDTGRFSHWKISYDRRSHAVFHGSYNINERSACHDFELGLLVKGQAFADKVKELIDYDLGVSRKITDKKEFFKHPWLHPSTYLNKVTRNYT